MANQRSIYNEISCVRRLGCVAGIRRDPERNSGALKDSGAHSDRRNHVPARTGRSHIFNNICSPSHQRMA